MAELPVPSVTIGLPVYNGANYLADAIESILSQTYSDFEFIISDNASTDETVRICEHYVQEDNRIRYHRSDVNKGAAWNYNYLVEQAKGKYFKWAAHDDICTPTFLESCVEVLDKTPSAVVCYPLTFVIDGDGEIIGNYSDNLHIRNVESHRRLRQYMRENFMRKGGMCNPVFGLIRLAALKQTTLIQPFVASDKSLLAQLAILGDFYELPERLFKRRVHNNISTFAHRDLQSRQSWFAASNTTRSQAPRKLWNNHFAVRYKQVKDLTKAISRFDIDSRSRRACYLELVRLFTTDLKWIYIDLKKSLGFSISRAQIMNNLKNNH